MMEKQMYIYMSSQKTRNDGPSISIRVATGQGKVREIQGQGKVREF